MEHSFTIEQISQLFQCSRRTIERRLRSFGIPRARERYSSISDDDLKQGVTDLVQNNPNLGEKSIDGLLRSNELLFNDNPLEIFCGLLILKVFD